jgi:hypothetical protein
LKVAVAAETAEDQPVDASVISQTVIVAGAALLLVDAAGVLDDEHAEATRATAAPAHASAASLLRFKTIPPLEGVRDGTGRIEAGHPELGRA